MKYKEKEPSVGTPGFIKQHKNSANKYALTNAPPKIKSDPRSPILRGFRFGNLLDEDSPWCDRTPTGSAKPRKELRKDIVWS
jgi:hypothetical protein